jgi:mRNA interferase MazF
MMPYKRGDVLLALFPDSNLRSSKRRPVLVVQADRLATGLPQVVVAMISSNLARLGHPSRVFIAAGTRDGQTAGLLHDSVVMADNLATLKDIAIDRALGHWTDMTSIDAALRHTLNL